MHFLEDFWWIFAGFLLDLLEMARQKSTKNLQKDSPTIVDFPLGKSAANHGSLGQKLGHPIPLRTTPEL